MPSFQLAVQQRRPSAMPGQELCNRLSVAICNLTSRWPVVDAMGPKVNMCSGSGPTCVDEASAFSVDSLGQAMRVMPRATLFRGHDSLRLASRVKEIVQQAELVHTPRSSSQANASPTSTSFYFPKTHSPLPTTKSPRPKNFPFLIGPSAFSDFGFYPSTSVRTISKIDPGGLDLRPPEPGEP